MTEPPALIITLSLEGHSRIRVQAECLEDEHRLIDWLRSALERREPLSVALADWLDRLDRIDEREAA